MQLYNCIQHFKLYKNRNWAINFVLMSKNSDTPVQGEGVVWKSEILADVLCRRPLMLICDTFKKQLWKYLKYQLWVLILLLIVWRLGCCRRHSYVNALILESISIIISSFNFKELWEILEFRFFQKFSDVRTFTNHPLRESPKFQNYPPPHLPDVLCRRPLSHVINHHSVHVLYARYLCSYAAWTAARPSARDDMVSCIHVYVTLVKIRF